jgi:hypothetical protein
MDLDSQGAESQKEGPLALLQGGVKEPEESPWLFEGPLVSPAFLLALVSLGIHQTIPIHQTILIL